MPVMFIPSITDTSNNEGLEMASVAKVAVLNVEKVSDLYPAIQSGENVLAQADPRVIDIIVEHASDILMEQMPAVIVDFPGCVYTRYFMKSTATLPPMDWQTLRRSMQRSGTVAQKVGDIPRAAHTSTRSTSLPSLEEAADQSISFIDNLKKTTESQQGGDSSTEGMSDDLT